MKNNEYNIVNVTNEKGTFVSEYTKAQNVEFSFQPENTNPIKDELNDNSTVNDKVEDNLSKKAREKEEKKEKKESEVESSEQLSSSSSSSAASSSSASSAASSSASSATAASAATASAGGIAGVVAAASVTVAVIGGAVGLTVIGQQPNELITFVASDVGTNYIDCTFRMPANLLSYDQDAASQDEISGEKFVMYLLEDRSGVVAKEAIFGEEIDEYTIEYYLTLEGLTADTDYFLTIYLEEQIPDVEPITTQLAYRTVRTLAESTAQSITFNSIDADYNQVSFAFLVPYDVVGYDPESPTTPAIQMEITNSGGYYDSIWLQSYEEYENDSLICFGEFYNLTQKTEYIINVSLSTETGMKLLGSESFTTKAKPSGSVTWGSVTTTENSVTFNFYGNANYIGWEEGGPTPNVTVAAYIDGEEMSSTSVTDFSRFDSITYRATGTLVDLQPGTTYELRVYFTKDDTPELLGTKEITTQAVPETFYFADLQYFYIGDDYINAMFYIRSSEVEYASGSQTDSNIQAVITGGMGYTQTITIPYDSFESALEDGYVFARALFESLDSNIAYTITVKNDNGDTYGDITVSTTGNDYGLDFEQYGASVQVTDSTFIAVFNLKYDESAVTDVSSVYCKVVMPNGTEVSSMQQCQNTSIRQADNVAQFRSPTITGLWQETDYVFGVYYNNNGRDVLTGVYNFTTQANRYGYELLPHTTTTSSITVKFTLNEDEVEIDESTGQSNIHVSIVEQGGGTEQNYNVTNFDNTQISGKYVCEYTFTQLQSETDYNISIFNDDVTFDTFTLGTYDGRSANFSFGSISTTSNSATIYFYISATYIDYETDPTAAQRNLYVKAICGGDTVNGTCQSLTVDSGDTLYGYFTVTGLDSQTTYDSYVYFGSEEDPLNEEPGTFTTEAINPTFNGVYVNDEAHYAKGEVQIALDFDDDPQNPEFEYLAIQFYDTTKDAENKGYLGSPITLEYTTSLQTITVTNDINLDEVQSFGIIQNQDAEIYTDDISFVNGDTYPTGMTISTNYSGAIVATNGSFIMPVKLNYTDDDETCKEGFTMTVTTNGNSYIATLQYTTEYQYAVFSSMASDVPNTFDVEITPTDNPSEILYTDTDIIQEADIDKVYAGSLTSDLYLSQNDSAIGFSLVYLNQDSQYDIQLVIIKGQDRYTYTLSLPSTPTDSEITLDLVDGTTFTSYADLQSLLEGNDVNIVIRYYDGAGWQEDVILAEDVQFTFA